LAKDVIGTSEIWKVPTGCQLGLPDFGSSFLKENLKQKIRHFFTSGLALDASRFSAPPVSLPAS
jgi:hypothetical protein